MKSGKMAILANFDRIRVYAKQKLQRPLRMVSPVRPFKHASRYFICLHQSALVLVTISQCIDVRTNRAVARSEKRPFDLQRRVRPQIRHTLVFVRYALDRSVGVKSSSVAYLLRRGQGQGQLAGRRLKTTPYQVMMLMMDLVKPVSTFHLK